MNTTQQLSEEQQKALQQYERQKELNKQRQRTYYAKHKEKIVQRRAAVAMQKKQELKQAISQMAIRPNYDEGVQVRDDDDEEEEVDSSPIINRNTVFSQNDLIQLLKNDKRIPSENTRKAYIAAINRLFKMTGCSDFKSCLQNYTHQMLKKIINAKGFKTNTIKLTLQAIVYVFDKYKMLEILFNTKKERDTIKAKFVDVYHEFTDRAQQELAKKQETMIYPTFKEYFAKIKELNIDENSKSYLIPYLYSQFTVRDNYSAMKIIASRSDDNEKDNFLLIEPNGLMQFIINKFKTKKRYNTLEFTVTGKLKTLLNNWIENNKLSYGSYLFGKSPLSKFVSTLNLKLGYEDLAGVGVYRHMRVSELLKNKDASYHERKALADEMGHSLMVQKQYQRNLNVI